EQYFLGIERKPPTQRHEKLKKRVVAIQTTTVKQTAVKFKAQSLNAKLITYERLWTRTLNEIEQGTYRRDVFKAKLHKQEREEKKSPATEAEAAPPPPPDEAFDIDEEPIPVPATAAAAALGRAAVPGA